MEKLRIREVLVVEGKYDAAALAGLVDGLILTTDGFSIFTNEEQKALLRRLGKQRGLLVLTDSDAAGFKIRHYVEKIAKGCNIKHAYIPAVEGKESRKAVPSKEGTLGVEGLPRETLRQALQQAGVQAGNIEAGRQAVSYTDLYNWGISGGEGSAQRRRAFLTAAGLPPRLSKRALCAVLGSLYTREEAEALARPRAALFWDFHGTLTLPDKTWAEVAIEIAAEDAPQHGLTREMLDPHLHGKCLPWFTEAERDTRHLAAPGAWWAHCEGRFTEMFENCGFAREQAAKMAAKMRQRVLQPARYALYPDAKSTLLELKRRGYRNYILSNNFPELAEIVKALGILPCFEQVLTSGKIGFEKPRREIFAAGRAAAGNSGECWMIGDNPADDMEGGKAAGFVTVAVHGVQAPAACHSIAELSELLDILP